MILLPHHGRLLRRLPVNIHDGEVLSQEICSEVSGLLAKDACSSHWTRSGFYALAHINQNPSTDT